MTPIPRVTTTLLAFLLLTGCAGFMPETGTAPTPPRLAAASSAPHTWWAVRFQLGWPEGEAPDFSADLLLADGLVGPALYAHERELFRWRFHRRAVRDDAGHRFSFIFQSDAATANAIFDAISARGLLYRLSGAGVVSEVTMTRAGDSDPAATSDPSWPESLQARWPVFIMGASATWLGMIEDCRADGPPDTDMASLRDHYRNCHADISATWHEWGQHAFLHHLAGLFGYEAMQVRKDITW